MQGLFNYFLSGDLFYFSTALFFAPFSSAILSLILLPRFLKVYTVISFASFFASSLLAISIASFVEYETMSLSINGFVFLFASKNSMIFVAAMDMIFAFVIVYSMHYIKKYSEHAKTFQFFINASVLFTFLAVFAGNLINLFLFYILAIFANYIVMVHGHTKAAWHSAQNYILNNILPAFLLWLPAITLIHYQVGTTAFATDGLFFGQPSLMLNSLTLLLFVYGIAKNAIVPIHTSLTNCIHLPTPLTIILHSISVNIGSISFMKIALHIYGIEYFKQMTENFLTGGWIFYLCGFVALYAAYKALMTKIIEKRLTYSTVSQLSYIILGISLCTDKAILGADLHLLSHALAKSVLLMIAGLASEIFGAVTSSQLKSVGKKIKIYIAIFGFFGASIAGIPMLFGFFGKYYIALSAFLQHNYFVTLVMIVGAIINVMYIYPIIYDVFLDKKTPETPLEGSEVAIIPQSMKVAIFGLTAVNLFLNIFGLWFVHWLT